MDRCPVFSRSPYPRWPLRSGERVGEEGRGDGKLDDERGVGVTQFQVYSSKTQGGTFLPVSGTQTAPKGNSSSYTVTFAAPKSATAKLFLKIKTS